MEMKYITFKLVDGEMKLYGIVSSLKEDKNWKESSIKQAGQNEIRLQKTALLRK